MGIKIDLLSGDASTLAQIDELMKKDSSTLGFLPDAALRQALDKRRIIGARDENNKIVGYLLYYKNKEMFRITHLCVMKEFRGYGISSKLFAYLKGLATAQKKIVLNCRKEFEDANSLWRKLGFTPLHEKKGRAKAGSILVSWCYTLMPDDQLSLFQSRVSDDTLDVVIDAQILFHFAGDTSGEYNISQSLLADFMVDVVQFWITDELYNEINRKKEEAIRDRNRQYAHSFTCIHFLRQKAELFEVMLKAILRSQSDSDISDIRHLSKIAASEIKIFVTLDNQLLSKQDEIYQATGVTVIDPTTLIIRCYENQKKDFHRPSHISGGLGWSGLSSTDIANINFDDFIKPGERLSDLKREIHNYCARPDKYVCQILRKGNKIFGIHIIEDSSGNKERVIHIARVKTGKQSFLHADFLVDDIIYAATQENCEIIKFSESGINVDVEGSLINAGFIENDGKYIKFCFPHCTDNTSAIESKLSAYLPDKKIESLRISGNMEHVCSPVDLTDNEKRYFIVPIRAEYAMNLYNKDRAARDLFGADNSVLLRYDNVYYRRKTLHHQLKVPAKILWYESGGGIEEGKITAISRLREVTIDQPKVLFKKYKRFGILRWQDIYNLCRHDVEQEIMALHFADTFLFNRPVTLTMLREIGICFFQTAFEIERNKFTQIFQLGFTRN